MVMKTEDIVKQLGCLEMKGGMHQISEELRGAIIEALGPKKPVKRSPGGRPLTEDEPPKVKGKTPE